jgi:hypothetical protein
MIEPIGIEFDVIRDARVFEMSKKIDELIILIERFAARDTYSVNEAVPIAQLCDDRINGSFSRRIWKIADKPKMGELGVVVVWIE